MDAQIIGAIITGSAAILAVLIPLSISGIKRGRELRRFKPIPKNVASNLEGTWVGYTQVRDDPTPRKYQAIMKFRPKRRRITGEFSVILENSEDNINEKGWTLPFAGGLIRDGFLQVDYWNSDININQFGSIILEVKNSRVLEGRFVAMGKDLAKMIYGKAKFNKQ